MDREWRAYDGVCASHGKIADSRLMIESFPQWSWKYRYFSFYIWSTFQAFRVTL